MTVGSRQVATASFLPPTTYHLPPFYFVPMPDIRTALQDRYAIEKEIGRGGMARCPCSSTNCNAPTLVASNAIPA